MLPNLLILFSPIIYENAFIKIFDLDPKKIKESSPMMSISTLNESGSNVACVLQNFMQNKEKKKKLTDILKDFLPFIESISTIVNNFDKSFSFDIKENFSGHSFRANYLSDGTVNIIAIVLALYFEDMSGITVLEEPERNIHPKLMQNLILSARNVSNDKQIIITTHNSEFLKHAKIEEVRLIKRDNEGFTKVSSPQNSDIVKNFMQNDLGLDDLFLQDMLGD
jgi:predicted ATPase